MRELYFDAPVGGLDSNMDVFRDFEGRASAQSPVSESRLTFEQRGSQTLVVRYDDDGGRATSASLDGLRQAVSSVYGVTHGRTREVTDDE